MFISSQLKTPRILSSTESSQFQGEWLTAFSSSLTFHAVLREGIFWFPPAVCISLKVSALSDIEMPCCIRPVRFRLQRQNRAVNLEPRGNRALSEALTEPIVPYRSGLIASCHSRHSIKIRKELTRHVNCDSDCTQAGRGAHRVIINMSWLIYLRNKCYCFHPLLRHQAHLNPADKNTCGANDRGPWQELQT